MKAYYEEAGIVIYNADNREVLPSLSGIDLILTSPPYNMGNSAGGGLHAYALGHYRKNAPMGSRGGSGRWKTAALANGYGEYKDNMPHDEYVDWQKGVLTACWDTLSPAGEL